MSRTLNQKKTLKTGEKGTAFEWSRKRKGTCTGAVGSRFPYVLAHRGVPQLPQYSHCFCITQLLSMHSHSDSKLLIMCLTPSKVQLSSPPFPVALQIRPLVLRAPHTTSPWLHKSASEPRETSELSGCNNTWWEPGFCCIIPPRDWAGLRKGQGWGSQGLLSSRSWEGLSPLPKSCTGSLCSTRPGERALSRICHLGPRWRDRGVWKGSIEGFGCVCDTRSPAWGPSVSLLGWFASPGFPSHSQSPLQVFVYCSRPLPDQQSITHNI